MAKAQGKEFTFDSEDHINSGFLETFLFDSKEQYIVTKTREFSAVCPFSGLPDIAKINIEYYAKGGLALELKALKYYLISYKNVGIYQEEVTKTIYNDLSNILKTKKIKITSKYNIRGGLLTTCSEVNLWLNYFEYFLLNLSYKICCFESRFISLPVM